MKVMFKKTLTYYAPLALLVFLFISCGGGEDSDSALTETPSVSSISVQYITPPADSTYGLGSSLDFQVVFNGAVIVSGTPCLSLQVGTDSVSACYTSGSGSNTINFSYVVQAGEDDVDGIELGNQIVLGVGGNLKDSSNLNVTTTISEVLPNLTSVMVSTSSGSPPDQVVSLNQTNLSDTRTDASFSWVEPADNGNLITSYIIRYKKTTETNYTYLNPKPTTTNATINGLEVSENYDVQVAAFNGVAGPYSPVLNFSTEFKPSSLGALVWYEAKDINGTGTPPADDDVITRLVDKSGNSNHADLLSPTGATVSTVDGKKVLVFSNNAFRTLYSLGETSNTDVEVYLIAKTRSVTTSFAFVNENQANSNRFGTHFPWSDNKAYVDLPIGNRLSGNWGGDINNFFAWTFRGSTTQGISLERNGTQILSAGNRTLTPPLKKWTIGAKYSGDANFWQADFVALFVFDKVLSSTQRADFFDFISDQYGITMVY